MCLPWKTPQQTRLESLDHWICIEVSCEFVGALYIYIYFFYPASPTKNCMVACLISDSAQIHRLIPSGFTHPNLSA